MGRLPLKARSILKPGPHAFAFCRNVDIRSGSVRVAAETRRRHISTQRQKTLRCVVGASANVLRRALSGCTNDSQGHTASSPEGTL